MITAPPPSGDETNVAHRERIADHPRRHDLGDCQGFLLPSDGVKQRPLARRDGDSGQLLARGAVLVHVARGGERIGGRRQERPERGLVRIVLAHRGVPPPDRPLGAAISDDRDLAESELQRRLGMRDMEHKGRAAEDRRVDKSRRNAEILGKRQT
jgi:hypothetical protein